jgi:hypothetical protein
VAENETNEALRAHVTRVGFDLTLGKSHIATLVWIDQMLKHRRHIRTVPSGPYRHAFANSAVGGHGLEDRGLIEHTMPDYKGWRAKGRSSDSYPVHRIWRITKAGRLVIALLKEAGVYQEYLEALPVALHAVEEAS